MRNETTNASAESTHFGRKKCGWLRWAALGCAGLRWRLALLHLYLALPLCLISRQQSGRLSHSHSHSPRLLWLSLCSPLVLTFRTGWLPLNSTPSSATAHTFPDHYHNHHSRLLGLVTTPASRSTVLFQPPPSQLLIHLINRPAG